MKRDMDVVRRILLEIEETGTCDTDTVNLKFLNGEATNAGRASRTCNYGLPLSVAG